MASVSGFLMSITPPMDVESSQYRLIRYILRHSMNGRPIRAIVLKNLAGGPRKFYMGLQSLTRVLRNRFGIILKAIRAPKSFWILRFVTYATEPMERVDEVQVDKRPGRILLKYVLTYLFVRGEKVEDIDLFNALIRMGIDIDGNDSYFGSGMRSLIEDGFVDMQLLHREYLVYPGNGPPLTFYSWGERAQQLFTYEIVVQYDYRTVNKLLDEINRKMPYEAAAAAAVNHLPAIL
ncbi:melanoma-associated antigen D4-like [Drosophila willistoni]|uniref:melanoma-associated antigen D4-like n=1 Tax=Drosophila willistoni TaxID=7260 RepID=UPI00017D8C10|nr:melanoma-associated antigen D4-like [Drosophila willistoni]